MSSKVLICGDREWNKALPILRELHKLPADTIIIHGAARGADQMAGILANELGMTVKPYPALWAKYKKAAGPIRNKQMLDENPDINLVLAFHENIDKSKGTVDMMERAIRAGIEVRLIKE